MWDIGGHHSLIQYSIYANKLERIFKYHVGWRDVVYEKFFIKYKFCLIGYCKCDPLWGQRSNVRFNYPVFLMLQNDFEYFELHDKNIF